MNIAIIGGGITGLTAAYDLAGNGASVELFEKADTLGGLARGFREPDWEWPLEGAYHHIFTNDTDIITLSAELGIGDDILISRPVTATVSGGRMYQLDSPTSLLTFPGIPFPDRLRTGMMLAFMKLNPFWQPLERFTAKEIFVNIGGRKAWKAIWEPLMIGKFSEFSDRVSAAWLWARVKKRTPKLGYFRGGFAHFTDTLAQKAEKSGARIKTGVTVGQIRQEKQGVTVTVNGGKRTFDSVLVTVPSPVFTKLVPALPAVYAARLTGIPHLHAQILILETTVPVLKGIYWLNITDRSYPFLAAVQHTNFIDRVHYGGSHILYLGNYLPENHPYMSMDCARLLQEFFPFVKRLNPAFLKSHIKRSRSFVGPFAQPVHTRNYSGKAPHLTTPYPDIYLANMDAIVPWDRGTNYAVKLGRDAAATLLKRG